MKTEKSKQEKTLDIVCWVVLSAAAIYFTFQILMGVISKFHMLIA